MNRKTLYPIHRSEEKCRCLHQSGHELCHRPNQDRRMRMIIVRADPRTCIATVPGVLHAATVSACAQVIKAGALNIKIRASLSLKILIEKYTGQLKLF
jgi:hypothetical protein